jgi:hypothetical protein
MLQLVSDIRKPTTGRSVMKLKLLFTALLSLPLWILSPAALAGATWTNVTVVTVSPCAPEEPGCGPAGFVEVQFSDAGTGGATCGNTQTKWAVLDITTPAGQALFKVVQDARTLGLHITAYGTGSCTIYPTLETLGTLNE